MNTPGLISRSGTVFAFVDKYDVERVCDYVFDAENGAGVVIVLSGWHDPYGGRGNASKTLRGKLQQLSGGEWRVGDYLLRPVNLVSFAPELDRAKAASYALMDSNSHVDPASI